MTEVQVIQYFIHLPYWTFDDVAFCLKFPRKSICGLAFYGLHQASVAGLEVKPEGPRAATVKRAAAIALQNEARARMPPPSIPHS